MCDNSRETEAAKRQGFSGGRSRGSSGGSARGFGLGRGALLGPAIVAVLRRGPATIDELAEQLDAITEGVLQPDGGQLAGTLADLEAAGYVRGRIVEGEGSMQRRWEITSEAHVRLQGIAERLRQRAQLTERIAELLAEPGTRR